MNKAFLAFASMIITGFVIKSYNKLKEKPATKEEIYRTMKAEALRRKRDDMARMNPKFGELEPSCYQQDAKLNLAQASNGCAMMGVAR